MEPGKEPTAGVLPVVKDVSSHEFSFPKKGIQEGSEVQGKWLTSQAATTLMDWIQVLNHSVLNSPASRFPLSALRDSSSTSVSANTILAALAVLDEMSVWVGEIPPQQQAQRFGNKAFRTWFERLQGNMPRLMDQVLAASPLSGNQAAAREIGCYLVEGVGNSTRIDYGTGHEMSFLAWMCCLHLVGAVHQDHFPYLVLHVFTRYLDLMRTLQRTYLMEPAGSHGVWGLDDFQFLPFLWGSAQFLGIHPSTHPPIHPSTRPHTLPPHLRVFSPPRFLLQTIRM